ERLGVGARSYRAHYRFRDASIAEARAWGWTQSGRPYEEALASFTAWVRAERPREAAEVVRGGALEFSGATAATIERLARAWAERSGIVPPWTPEHGPTPYLSAPGVAWSWTLGSAHEDWINRVVERRDGALVAVGFVERDDDALAPDWNVVVL